MEAGQEFRVVRHRLKDNCQSKFATVFNVGNRIHLPNPSWFYRYDSQFLEIRAVQDSYDSAILSKSASDFSASGSVIVDCNHVKIQGRDYLLVRTMNRKSTFLHLLDIYTRAIHKLEMEIPIDSESKIAVSQSFESIDLTFVIYKGSQFYVGNVAINLENAVLMFRESGLICQQLQSNQFITAVDVYSEDQLSTNAIFLGTKEGVIEVWQQKDGSINYLTSEKSSDPISYLRYDPPFGEKRHGTIFLCHEANTRLRGPLLESFKVSSNLTNLGREDHPNWKIEHPLGELSCFKLGRIVNGYKIIVIIETFDTEENESALVTQIFETNSISIAESVVSEITDAGSVRDIVGPSSSKHFKVLFSLRAGQFINELTNIEENVSANLVKLPQFDQWFGRDVFPYTSEKIELIKNSRMLFDTELYFDKLIQMFGIPTKSYPPESVTQLEIMVATILKCESQSMTIKLCVVKCFN